MKKQKQNKIIGHGDVCFCLFSGSFDAVNLTAKWRQNSVNVGCQSSMLATTLNIESQSPVKGH